MPRLPRLRSSSLCLAALGFGLAPSPRASAQEPLGAADRAGQQWISLRVEAARLDSEWRTQREVLGSLVAATQERARLAEEKRDLALAKTAQERRDLADLRAKDEAAAADLKAADARLNALCLRLLALRPKLPPRLSDALEMSFRTLGAPRLDVGERMQTAMNVLNRCAQFDRAVFCGEDMLTLEGEPPNKLFEVIYWGLSHAYALDRGAHRAWLGSPGPDHWRWTPAPDAYDSVAKLIAIANDRAEPQFVAVPGPALRQAAAEPAR